MAAQTRGKLQAGFQEALQIVPNLRFPNLQTFYTERAPGFCFTGNKVTWISPEVLIATNDGSPTGQDITAPLNPKSQTTH